MGVLGDDSNSADNADSSDGATMHNHEHGPPDKGTDIGRLTDAVNDSAGGAETKVVAEPEPLSTENDESATATVEGTETNDQISEPIAMAEAAPNVESLAPQDVTDADTDPNLGLGTDNANDVMAADVTVPSGSALDTSKTAEPVVVAAEHASEPMVVAESLTSPTDPAVEEDSKADPPLVVAVEEGTPVIGASKPADSAVPSKGLSKAPSDPGKIVEGVVTAVTTDGVELTLDDGRPAFISRRNFGLNDEAPDTILSVGDRSHGAELNREDPKSRVVLSRSWALKRQAWDKILAASTEGKPITGRVVSGSKKGVVVDVGVRGFVPMSHLELEPVADMAPYIDQSFEFKILEVDAQKEKLVLSRRSFLLKAQRKEMQEIISGIKPGEVRTGKVSSFAEYGAFIDLGGVSGLAHISELSWDRVGKPSDVLTLGQEVEVMVLDVKAKKKRISLSLRQVSKDPLDKFEVGSVLSGPVTRLVDFGAFVLVDGFEGLVHLSELAEYRVSAPEEIVAPGDVVGVKVLSIDPKRRRLELSIRRAAEYQG